MKKVLLMVVLLLAGYSYSQNNTDPKLEKVGKLIKATYYHDNGEIAQTGYMLQGELHGQWFMYDVNGKKVASGKYNKGAKDGKWFFWDDQILREVDFANNQITNVKNWNQSEIVSIH
ncbi:hypothetical protein GCM10011414_07400 [Croceivirga lutea]|uniref:nicotinic acid mononucleotide adenyltransferase n=1 Tax=Croceivirga lutea TaxID=1775167 RepID=UPI00163A136B|nr:nicotinic acid mononucleotide adenyltransferase [Croceivirga lutea]GGG40404.1 hypothetical protein GCM10011414_07400 [Croceivirga lutea]